MPEIPEIYINDWVLALCSILLLYEVMFTFIYRLQVAPSRVCCTYIVPHKVQINPLSNLNQSPATLGLFSPYVVTPRLGTCESEHEYSIP